MSNRIKNHIFTNTTIIIVCKMGGFNECKQSYHRSLIALMIISTSLAVFTSYITPESVEAASYSWGSEGSTVRKYKPKLKQWGYYNGNVDGNTL